VIFGGNKRSIACGELRKTERGGWPTGDYVIRMSPEQEAKDLNNGILPGADGFYVRT